MTETQLAELLLALSRHGSVPDEGPSAETMRSWVTMALASRDAIQSQVETILQGPNWVVTTMPPEYALSASQEARTLLPIPMPDPNVVVHLNYRRQQLSVEHLAATPNSILQVVVQFPPPKPQEGRLRQALHAALGLTEPAERIEALLAVLPLSDDATIQLSILDAANREARRLKADQQAEWLPAIAQTECALRYQSSQWVRYGVLTETQQQGGVAFFAADGWLATIRPKEESVQIACQLVNDDHTWNLQALQESLAEIHDVDPLSERCWRDWLTKSLPAVLQSDKNDLLCRLRHDA